MLLTASANKIDKNEFLGEKRPAQCKEAMDEIFPQLNDGFYDKFISKDFLKDFLIDADLNLPKTNCNGGNPHICDYPAIFNIIKNKIDQKYNNINATISGKLALINNLNEAISMPADGSQATPLQQIFNFKPINACLHAISRHYPVKFIQEATAQLKINQRAAEEFRGLQVLRDNPPVHHLKVPVWMKNYKL